ncbi:hypothetical protein [Pilimelia terevasa]|nr:hypothetical protein [Pilimelia terevasa]
MKATPQRIAASPGRDARTTRLRVDVYDALAAAKVQRKKVVDLAAIHGISRQHLFDIRSGRCGASLGLALRMASDLDTTVEVLFERAA